MKGDRIGRFRLESRLMLHDFPQPDHYIRTFEMWAMDHDEYGCYKI